jgi:polyhydroxybutyrate depolymerase
MSPGACLAALLALGPQAPAAAAPPIQRGSVRVGALERTYLYHAPPRLPPGAPLVLAFHSSGNDGEGMRYATGYELEALADRHGFVVVYPDGFRGNWNDCRKQATYPARALDIDDEGFVRALIARFMAEMGVDPGRVFAAGYSNGAHFAFRLALEMPERIAGIAAVAAGLPTDDNSVCRRSNAPISTLIIDGTGDPISPFGGGHVIVRGEDRGAVLSAPDTAAYFARLAGLGAPTTARLPHAGGASDGTHVERTTWAAPGRPEVVLDAVHGGGHVLPQTRTRMPAFLGAMTGDLDGPAEIWSFFARQRPRPVLAR